MYHKHRKLENPVMVSDRRKPKAEDGCIKSIPVQIYLAWHGSIHLPKLGTRSDRIVWQISAYKKVKTVNHP